MSTAASEPRDAPGLGAGRLRPDPRLWSALLSEAVDQRADAVRVLHALDQAATYARLLLGALNDLAPRQRVRAGEALALLGDPRLSPPHYLPEMLPVPAGEVILGSPDYPDERPVHRVRVRAFSLAEYPVTYAAYAAFIAASGRRAPQGWRKGRFTPDLANKPVVFVSVGDAQAYCAWLSSETGFHYRLPSEAEWVLAARGHDAPRVYPWGDVYRPLAANCWGEGAARELCAVGLHPAGTGPFGHHDLAGNVWEWCSSLYWPYPYNPLDGRENPDPREGIRVMHGGSWRSRPTSVRCAARQGEHSTDSFEVVGFRIARDGGA